MKSKFCLILIIGLCLPFFGSAQSGGDFVIKKSVIASGGGTGSDAGGTFSITSVNGQPAAGTRMTNSPFAVSTGFFAFNLAPTATFAVVRGRVFFGESTPIKNAVVRLSGGNLTTPLIAITNDLGYFTFSNVEVGHFYVLSVSHKNFGFGQNTQTFTLVEDMTGLVFRADWET